eukprot:TRINITY_DN44547_c0_g1_i1.p1 TRINITY_DN44547_c0_g1~~TRINITY_DN44547_c0_g1_i1.p1  ORF type:complete len:774 (+),score=199.39 TRINITY_DN44547_c0_g1_i1:122-2443(+)
MGQGSSVANPGQQMSADQIGQLCELFLSRQEKLVNQLEGIVQQQHRTLAALGEDADDFDGEEREAAADPSAATLEDEYGAISAAADRATRRDARRYEPPDATEQAVPDEDLEEEGRGFTSTKPWLGSMAPPSGWKPNPDNDQKPTEDLILEHVYGYRARSCRNNLAMIDDQRIVFHAAAVGVVHNTQTNEQHFFMGHDDDIVSLAYHPATRMVATGQQGKKPSIRVWCVDDPSKELACLAGFHERAVVSLAFSADGTRLLSAGLDDEHSIAVHRWQEGNGGLEAKAKTGGAQLFDLQYNQSEGADANMQFVTVGMRTVNFWTQDGATLKDKRGLLGKMGEQQAFPSVNFCAEFTVVCTGGGQLYLFAENKLRRVVNAHSGPCVTVTSCNLGGQRALLSGGQDGKLIVWDAASMGSKAPKKVAVVDVGREAPAVGGTNAIRASYALSKGLIAVGCANGSIYKVNVAKSELTPQPVLRGHYGDLSARADYGELWGLALHPTQSLAASAGEDSTLRVWDLTRRTQVAEVVLGVPALSCDWAPNGQWIVVGCRDGRVAVVDATHGTKVAEVAVAKDRVPCIRYSPCGQYVAAGTGSRDRSVLIFSVDRNTGALALTARGAGPTSTVLHIDWAVDSSVMCIDTQAYELMYFEPSGKYRPDARTFKDTPMATQTCVLGFSVQGIWPKHSNGTDVNNCAKSRSGQLLATCDDFGFVNVYQYPCIGSGLDSRGKLKRRPAASIGEAHSEHVTNVGFSSGDKWVMSAGGADNCVMQWRLVAR